MKVKEESENVGLKLNVKKMNFLASGSITLWQIDGGKQWKQWQTLFSWAPKSLQMLTTAIKLKDTCSLEEKTLAPMTNLDSILKSRDITLPTKVCLLKAIVFPVVMYGCESWTIMKADHQRIDALNCGVGEDSWESLGQQGDPTSPS